VGIARDRILPVDNGAVIEIDGDVIRRRPARVPAGYVYVDGLSIDEAGDVVLRDRRLLAQDGVVIVALTVERGSGAVVAGPDLMSRGFIEDTASDTLFDEAREHTLKLVQNLSPDADWTVWQASIHEGLSKFLYSRTRRRPMILPVVTEV
jgi:ribonuclease J